MENKTLKIIIIGGVAGGASAATRARRVNPNAEICIFEKGPDISYANCGIPYHLGAEIPKRESLIVTSPEMFKNRFGIKVKTSHQVESIDRTAKTILVRDLSSGKEFKESYDKLIISTGASLRKLPIDTDNLTNFFSLWTLQDLDSILEKLANLSKPKVSVIGAGFVGLEVVEQLHRIGATVDLIELAPQVLSPLDPEMANFIESELIDHQTNIHLNQSVQEFTTENGQISSILLSNGRSIGTDLVIAGIGVVPNSSLAKECGLELSENGCIKVDQVQRTSDHDIYAVGDVSEYVYGPTLQKVSIPLAGPANRSGRIAGEHAANDSSQFSQKVFGTSIVRVFNQTAALTGLSEKLCARLNIKYKVAYIAANHHAGYFPGAKNITLKVLYEPNTGKLLGAQAVGEEGVDKRIDIISTVLHFGGSAQDLANLDLAYAPPFGSAKDPVHQVANVILNDLDNRPKLLPPGQSLDKFQIVDVRTEKETKELPLENANWIPIDDPKGDIRTRVKHLATDKPTVVVCHSGKRAHIAASMLVGLGFSDVYNLTGGMMIRSKIFPSHLTN